MNRIATWFFLARVADGDTRIPRIKASIHRRGRGVRRGIMDTDERRFTGIDVVMIFYGIA